MRGPPGPSLETPAPAQGGDGGARSRRTTVTRVTAPAPERPATRVGLSRTAGGDDVPLAGDRARRRPRLEDPVVSWTASIAVMLLAFAMRLVRLGQPRELAFDETYYAKDAWSLVHHGYVREYVENADQMIERGDLSGLWKADPSMIVHPEVGKWLIGLGELVFGMDPVGWRVPSVVVGSLMVLVMVRLVRRLTGSTMLGCVAGLLLALDGLHFVLSRLALLDIFAAFFTLCAVHCLVVDRERHRDRMARWWASSSTGRSAGAGGRSAGCCGGRGSPRPA